MVASGVFGALLILFILSLGLSALTPGGVGRVFGGMLLLMFLGLFLWGSSVRYMPERGPEVQVDRAVPQAELAPQPVVVE